MGKKPTWQDQQLRQAAAGAATLSALHARIRHDSDCAVHNAPALPVGPCNCGVAITAALEHARLALASTNNCLTTDRPDLPRAPDTGWTTDFTKEIALIDEALAVLGFSSRSDRRSGICRTDPSSAQT